MNGKSFLPIEYANLNDWKSLCIPYGEESLCVRVPPECVTLRMKKLSCPPCSGDAIASAIEHPIGSSRLDEIIRSKGKPIDKMSVCITASDITRPVPYKGKTGILRPLLDAIEQTGISPKQIVILIGNGMHRASTPDEKILMFGQNIVDHYRIVDHECENLSSQVLAAHTTRGTAVYVNKTFYEADVKIVTGLVESHFMAGVSGGRKGVCPALVNTTTIQKFHGPDFLEHPNAANMILDGNPCHEESLEVALSVGVDFLVNVTLDNQLNLTGVFAGNLVKAHQAAVDAIKKYVQIPIEKPFDIVLTHGGYVGRNHYQCAKAAVGAMPAVKDNGIIILAANNHDAEPVGSAEYKTLLHLFKILGPDRYVSILRHPEWIFTKDQWQPEMWGKPLRKVGMDGLIYCAPQIPRQDLYMIPGISGYDFLDPTQTFNSDKEKTEAMVQNALIAAVHHPRFGKQKPTIAFIEEGPYAIPVPTA